MTRREDTTPASSSSRGISVGSAKALAEYLSILAGRRNGKRAVIIRLSQMTDSESRIHQIRIALRVFQDLIPAGEGKTFGTTNGDIYHLFDAYAARPVRQAVDRVMGLFADAPWLLHIEPDAPQVSTNFIEWLDLERDDFEQLSKNVGLLPEGSPVPIQKAEPASPAKRSVIDSNLVRIVERSLERADIHKLIHRQPICSISSTGALVPSFHEIFISVSDLSRTLANPVDLSGNRWLFQYLTTAMDRRLIGYLTEVCDHNTAPFSINSNVETILGPEFETFERSLSSTTRSRMTVEFQVADILVNPAQFLFARDYLKQSDIKVCLDGITREAMELLDIDRFEANYVKIIWNEILAEPDQKALDQLHQRLRACVAARPILCRCDAPEAVDLGVKIGITMFQGHAIDSQI